MSLSSLKQKYNGHLSIPNDRPNQLAPPKLTLTAAFRLELLKILAQKSVALLGNGSASPGQQPLVHKLELEQKLVIGAMQFVGLVLAGVQE